MTNDVPMSASQEINGYSQLEIDSAPAELRPLLVMLCSPEISAEEVSLEFRKVHNGNSSYLTEYVVPYSGMYVIFYVAQRFSRPTSDASKTESDCIELFGLLVNEYGANPNCLDGVMKQSVLFYTSKYGYLRCCQELVEVLGVNASISDIHCQTALFYAAREGHSAVVEWLVGPSGRCEINHIDRNGQTALFYAAREDRFECVMKMINELGADPLIRDMYKKRARSYLKGSSHKRTFDFLTEVEKARDPNMSSSHRKLFLVRPDEPMGAAAMTLRQHKPFNPFQEEEQHIPLPPIKRQRSSGTTTPVVKPVVEHVVVPKAEPAQPPKPTPPARNRFKVKAPLGQGGLESFEKEFPEFALWLTHGGVKGAGITGVSPNAKAPSRTPRTPAAGLTPQWVTVVSQLLRGPLWRYGPATIFHKQVLMLPPNLGPEYVSDGVERKLSIDLSIVRKKLEKGKYLKLTEIDKDIRSMFQQAKDLTTDSSDLAVLTRATEVYYEQQMAGSGLSAIIRQESEQAATAARNEILNPVV